jgi:hypothetical protein
MLFINSDDSSIIAYKFGEAYNIEETSYHYTHNW